MIDANTTLENAIQTLDEQDNTGTLSIEWQRVLRWLYELLDYRRQHEWNREFAEDERWD